MSLDAPSARNFISPVSLSGIEQIVSVKLLGIHLTASLSAAAYVEHILSVANQRLHLPGLLKYQGLSPEALHTAIVQSVITYALPSFAGQLSKVTNPGLMPSSVKLSNAVCLTHPLKLMS